jgi:peptidase E
MKRQIIAMGGGGFSMEPDNLALDRYVLEQANKPDPAVAFLGCNASHLSLFRPHTSNIERYIMEQDIIYVGGGNTRSMLALWREWELDVILREAYEAGIVLAGISAGAICWFYQGTTDSNGKTLGVLPCLGLLPGSCSPHYDGEPERRPYTHSVVKSGEMRPGYGLDDSAAVHFVDGDLYRAVASREGATAYYIDKQGDDVVETPQEMTLLSPVPS